MYTQCPECSMAFRVTADVLKQAAGKVRCGGCGNAFNALEYLSESMPQREPEKTVEDDLPELKPEPLPDDAPPLSISAEQSAALLKTLDELAGSDIRIEDTGVEWRVLDDDEVGEAAGDEIAMDIDVEDQPEIDEILEDSPTPVDQFLTDTPPEVDSPEIFSEEAIDPSRAPVDELRFDDNTPLPDDFDLGDEAPFSPISKETKPEPEPKPIEVPQVDLDLSEPDEWTDILDEFEDLVGDLTDEDEVEDEDAGPLDVDSQFALQAEAMGIDLSGMHETLEAPVAEETVDSDIDEDLDTLLGEPDAAERDIEDLLEEEIVEEIDGEPEYEDHDEIDVALEDISDEEIDEDVDEAPGAQLELIEEAEDEPETDAVLDEEPEDEPETDAVLDEEPEDVLPTEYYVPPMTEEEQTINMQIDQDLLAIAVEDKDGFASTMILPEDAADTPLADADENDDDTDQDPGLADTSAGFETIIMEGEFVRSDLEQDKLAADAAAAAALAGAAAADREAEQAGGERKVNYGMVAGLVTLVLLLIGQIVHQSRHTLATIPAFNDTVGPLYRAIGQPLSPDWDITGWRFEVTEQKTAEDDSNLVVYSRIGNKSDKALPYPIIAVSLTDRFQEPLGRVTLDPADYLANDLDPRRLVEPGNTFEANFTVNAIPEEAASYQLRACYRSESGLLRCKEDDFK